MEEVFDTLDCRLKVSGTIADQFMMEVLRSAMDEAYGRICRGPREGRDLGRLNDRSRFCELAIVQLEWCLRFLQEEVDVYIVESGRERKRLLLDLADTRDRMQMRMEEIESDIREKDLELMRRAEVEVELARELAVRDREVRRLRAAMFHRPAHPECCRTNITVDVEKESMGVARRTPEIGDQAEGGTTSVERSMMGIDNPFAVSSTKATTTTDERQWSGELEKAVSDIAVRDQLTLLRHTLRRATDAIDDFESERSVKEDIDRTIFAEIVKDVRHAIRSATSGRVGGGGGASTSTSDVGQINLEKSDDDDDDLESVLTQLKHFSQSIVHFEAFACDKLVASMSRLGNLQHRINPLFYLVDSLKNKRMLYQKAFIRRCFDLQTAEAEVDLLGDEVDALQRLLGEIHHTPKTLPVFSTSQGVDGCAGPPPA